jgi:hypothetical protein
MMNHLPPLNIIQIFVRNRLANGWSHERVAAALRHRLHLADTNPATLSPEQRQRYDSITALLATLEQPHVK